MKKKDLKTGMVVENNEGNKYLVILDIRDGVIVRDGVYDDLCNFDDKLVNSHIGLAINRVYCGGSAHKLLSLDHGELLWEREEDKFKDLKRAYSEGDISIESWDKHKEVIKEYWEGKEREAKFLSEPSDKWSVLSYPSFDSSSVQYRVKEQKTEELTVEQIEAKLGYKIKIVGEK